MFFGQLIRQLVGPPHSRFFRFGMNYLVRVPAVFAREAAVGLAIDYIVQNKIEGDYCEFGVWTGRTFSAARYFARERKAKMRFWAFDSFQGLPSSEGEFQEGAYRYGKDAFLENVRRNTGELSDVKVVPGWFSESLRASNPEVADLHRIAIAWVDCDLYESTVPVLEFLTAYLQDGSLIFFDDWFCLKGRPDQGEQRACREWLAANPKLSLSEFWRFGWHGLGFVVHRNLSS